MPHSLVALLLGGAVGAVAGTAIGTAVGTIATGAAAGALGSIASQGVGLAFNIQDKFSWKSVALPPLAAAWARPESVKSPRRAPAGLAAVLAAVPAPRLNSSFGQGFIAGAAGNIASQGIGVATGLQHSFSWAGVAAAGVGGGASNWLASKVDLGKIGHAVADERGLGFSGKLEEQVAMGVAAGLRGAANALASAATRSAIEGSSFGDNIIAAIPDVIGQVIDSAIRACFTGETLVHTPGGLRRIDEIKVGDWVYARDEDFNTPMVHRGRVEKLFCYENKATLYVTVMDANKSETSIRTTPEHPFAIDGAGWVAASDLTTRAAHY